MEFMFSEEEDVPRNGSEEPGPELGRRNPEIGSK